MISLIASVSRPTIHPILSLVLFHFTSFHAIEKAKNAEDILKNACLVKRAFLLSVSKTDVVMLFKIKKGEYPKYYLVIVEKFLHLNYRNVSNG